MSGGTQSTAGAGGVRRTSRAGPPQGVLHRVAEVACGPCEKTGKTRYIAQLEQEGTRLDLTAFTKESQTERQNLERSLEWARTHANDPAAVTAAEERIKAHRAKLRAQLGPYIYRFDSRVDQTGKAYAVPCPRHGVLVIGGPELAGAVSRYAGRRLVVLAQRPHHS